MGFEYGYILNPDFDLRTGDWIDSDNDDLLFGKENEPSSEKAVILSLDLLQNASALASSYPRRKRRLQSPVTVLQFLLTSKLVKKRVLASVFAGFNPSDALCVTALSLSEVGSFSLPNSRSSLSPSLIQQSNALSRILFTVN